MVIVGIIAHKILSPKFLAGTAAVLVNGSLLIPIINMSAAVMNFDYYPPRRIEIATAVNKYFNWVIAMISNFCCVCILNTPLLDSGSTNLEQNALQGFVIIGR